LTKRVRYTSSGRRGERAAVQINGNKDLVRRERSIVSQGSANGCQERFSGVSRRNRGKNDAAGPQDRESTGSAAFSTDRPRNTPLAALESPSRRD